MEKIKELKVQSYDLIVQLEQYQQAIQQIQLQLQELSKQIQEAQVQELSKTDSRRVITTKTIK